jgi:hypothetical protein
MQGRLDDGLLRELETLQALAELELEVYTTSRRIVERVCAVLGEGSRTFRDLAEGGCQSSSRPQPA